VNSAKKFRNYMTLDYSTLNPMLKSKRGGQTSPVPFGPMPKNKASKQTKVRQSSRSAKERSNIEKVEEDALLQ
jgi:hypothetical protein